MVTPILSRGIGSLAVSGSRHQQLRRTSNKCPIDRTRPNETQDERMFTRCEELRSSTSRLACPTAPTALASSSFGGAAFTAKPRKLGRPIFPLATLVLRSSLGIAVFFFCQPWPIMDPWIPTPLWLSLVADQANPTTNCRCAMQRKTLPQYGHPSQTSQSKVRESIHLAEFSVNYSVLFLFFLFLFSFFLYICVSVSTTTPSTYQ